MAGDFLAPVVVPVSAVLPALADPAHGLVADIGGTHARFAWADAQGALLARASVPVAAYPSITTALAAVVPDGRYGRALGLAVAGQVDAAGNARTANLPWTIRAAELQACSGRPVRVLNDFHALALGCAGLSAGDGVAVCGPDDGDDSGPLLVIGPGTGLGAAIVLPGTGLQVLPSEAGQMALAASDARQAAVIEHLRGQRGDGHVSVEAIVSGPGLLAAYRALCALAGVPAGCSTPEQVSAAAMAGSDEYAMQAFGLFVRLLGGFCADLAMATGAARIWLAGGIVPALGAGLNAWGFADALQQRGVHSPWLAQRPVRAIEHGALGLLGAARALCDQPRAG